MNLGIAVLLIQSLIVTSTFAAGQASEPLSVLIWDDLERIQSEARVVPPQVEKYLNHPIEVAGYIIANEFGSGELTQFILTHYAGGCIHVPLPPPNSMIEVEMTPGKKSGLFFKKRVVVKGVLSLGHRVDAAYKMLADEVRELPFN
jgi:hypothetical protein